MKRVITLCLTILFFGSCNSDFNELQFDTISTNNDLQILYEQNHNNEYLKSLRSKFPIDSLIVGAKTDSERVKKILFWVHNQWKHDGNNEPLKGDAISILDEVKEGKNFRCVEYGIVTSACLNAVGLKTRTLGLKTADVETRRSGAGHVGSEVFLNDLNKWVFIDAQWDVIPVLNNTPLNAVEFQQAIASNNEELEIQSSKTSKDQYAKWIFPYLFYFDIAFDNTEGVNLQRKTIEGKPKLMLVPVGAPTPTIFQRENKINAFYTNSINDFYAAPE